MTDPTCPNSPNASSGIWHLECATERQGCRGWSNTHTHKLKSGSLEWAAISAIRRVFTMPTCIPLPFYLHRLQFLRFVLNHEMVPSLGTGLHAGVAFHQFFQTALKKATNPKTTSMNTWVGYVGFIPFSFEATRTRFGWCRRESKSGWFHVFFGEFPLFASYTNQNSWLV